mmetsp:Transcript_15407/g.62016  ORF Transcript_15407/g.62016 Transcript_15407/m.62016 type:complete len:84 (-) Transcript_15407:1809-2060(-)
MTTVGVVPPFGEDDDTGATRSAPWLLVSLTTGRSSVVLVDAEQPPLSWPQQLTVVRAASSADGDTYCLYAASKASPSVMADSG